MDRRFLKRSPIVFGSFVIRHMAIEEAHTVQTLHVCVGDAVFFMRVSCPGRTHKRDMCVT